MNQFNGTNRLKSGTCLDRFPFAPLPLVSLTVLFLVSAIISVHVAFRIESVFVLIIPVAEFAVVTHFIAISRVVRKYKKIAMHLPPETEVTMSFWHLECTFKTRESLTYVLYLPGFCPYYFWIDFTYASKGVPEHYQVWKAAPWWGERVYLNPYDYDRFMYQGFARQIFARIKGYPLEKEFSLVEEELEKLLPRSCNRFKSIQNVIRVGFARWCGKNVLLAVLRRSAHSEDVAATILLLNEMEEKIKTLK